MREFTIAGGNGDDFSLLESEVNPNVMNSRLANLLRRPLSADADGEHELRLECPELQ
jgi:hypothetical protein